MPVRRSGGRRGRWVAVGRDHRWAIHPAVAVAPGGRRIRARGAVVGAWAAPGPGPGGTKTRRLARNLPCRGARRVRGDVGRGGPVGMAGTVPAGARPDLR